MTRPQSAAETAERLRKALVNLEPSAVAELYFPRSVEDKESLTAAFAGRMDRKYEVSDPAVEPYVQPDWEIFHTHRFEPEPTHSIRITLNCLERIIPDCPPGKENLYFTCAPGEDGYGLCYYVDREEDEDAAAKRERLSESAEREAIEAFEELVQPYLNTQANPPRQVIDDFVRFYEDRRFEGAFDSLMLEWGAGRVPVLDSFRDLRETHAEFRFTEENRRWIRVSRTVQVGKEDDNPCLCLVLSFHETGAVNAGFLEVDGHAAIPTTMATFYDTPDVRKMIHETPATVVAFVDSAG